MVKIEFLYPEIANLYGDPFNVKYLQKCLKDVQVIETSLTDEPKFVKEDIDMIYMGSMSEKAQVIVIEKLKQYKNELQDFINNNKVALFTGNSFEILGKYIEDEEQNKVEGLGIIDTYAKLDRKHRYNTLFLGKCNCEEDIKVLGFKATFSFSYTDNTTNYFCKSIRGCGNNKESELEGVRINNLFGTYLIGPVLVINPVFTKYLMRLLGEENPELQFEKEAMECYEDKLKIFEKEEINYLQ